MKVLTILFVDNRYYLAFKSRWQEKEDLEGRAVLLFLLSTLFRVATWFFLVSKTSKKSTKKPIFSKKDKVARLIFGKFRHFWIINLRQVFLNRWPKTELFWCNLTKNRDSLDYKSSFNWFCQKKVSWTDWKSKII